MPSLFRFLLVVGVLGGLGYGGIVRAGQYRRSAAARDHRDDPAGQALQAPLTRARAAWPAGRAQSDDTLIELFLDMLAAERGAARNTLDAYRRDLADFSADLASAGGRIAATPAATTCARYLGRLGKRGLAAASVARRLSAIRQLYRFLYSEGHRGDDPAAVIEGPKRGRSLPKVLSRQAGRRSARAGARRHAGRTPSAERLRAARLACLLEVLYATGLRVSELVALPESAARRDQRMLVVRGKGGRERLVPLNDAAKRAMADYLALRAEAKRGANRNGCFRRSARAAI